MLKVLTHKSGQYVDYEQMLREAWDGTLVSRHTVAVTVGEVKKALKEYGSWISYRPKLGYRFDVPQTDDLIRKGWHYWGNRTREGIQKALDCFQEAARQDETDFRAHEGISLSYLTLGACGMRPPREVYSAFLEAHKRAVVLAGLTPELRSDRGHGLHMFEHRFAEAEADLLEAQREKPRAANAVRLMMLYTALGRLDEALDVLTEAYTLEPLWPMLPAAEINVRFIRREFDCAVACGKQALELHPYVHLVRVFYAQALEYSGKVEEALVQYRVACVMCPDLPWFKAMEGTCLGRHGRQSEARRIVVDLEQLRSTEYVDAYYMALLYDAVGDRDRAFAEMDRALEENSATLNIVDVDPKLDCLRRDPRFARLRHSIFAGTEQALAFGSAV